MQGDGRPGTGGTPFERRLATILMADIVGYSRMMEANEERTLRVFRGHREIVDAMLAQHRGRMFNTAGDAVLAEFPSAVDAVRCATEIQSALRTRNDHLSPDERMQFRIGVNLGDVIVQGTDLLGDGVNVAARIQTAAEPGGVCVSGSVYDQIRNKLSLEFHAMGERTFKNITQPVRVFSIGDGDGERVAAAPAAPPVAAAAAPTGSRRVGTVFAVAAALAIAAGAGWWYVQDRDAKAAEAARAIEATRAAEQAAAVDAAKRKAEEEAAVRVAAEREARLRAELETAQRAAAEATKRADAARAVAAKPASPPARAPEKSSPSAAVSVPVAAPAVAAVPAATAKPAFPHDGSYRGRACWAAPGAGKGPQCWSLELAIDEHRIDASWFGTYGGGRPSSIRGQVSATGTVTALFEGFGAKGKSVMSELGGRAVEGRLSFSGALNNGARIDGSAIRVR